MKRDGYFDWRWRSERTSLLRPALGLFRFRTTIAALVAGRCRLFHPCRTNDSIPEDVWDRQNTISDAKGFLNHGQSSRFLGMETASVTTNGHDQTVQLPEGFQLDVDEVYVKRIGRSVLLIPKDADPWSIMAESLGQFTGDFMEERSQPRKANGAGPFINRPVPACRDPFERRAVLLLAKATNGPRCHRRTCFFWPRLRFRWNSFRSCRFRISFKNR